MLSDKISESILLFAEKYSFIIKTNKKQQILHNSNVITFFIGFW